MNTITFYTLPIVCIAHSAGRNGHNSVDDVKTVQILLNLNLDKMPKGHPLSEDGTAGPSTIAAIEEFQRRILGIKKPDGRVDPNGPALTKLRQGMPTTFTKRHLHGIMIHATDANILKYFP